MILIKNGRKWILDFSETEIVFQNSRKRKQKLRLVPDADLLSLSKLNRITLNHKGNLSYPEYLLLDGLNNGRGMFPVVLCQNRQQIDLRLVVVHQLVQSRSASSLSFPLLTTICSALTIVALLLLLLPLCIAVPSLHSVFSANVFFFPIQAKSIASRGESENRL